MVKFELYSWPSRIPMEPWSVQLPLQYCEVEPLDHGDGRSDELRPTMSSNFKVWSPQLEAPIVWRKALLACCDMTICHLELCGMYILKNISRSSVYSRYKSGADIFKIW